MPLTYKQLAHQLAEAGYDRDAFNYVVEQISGGQSSYQISPDEYIEESVVQDLLPYTPAEAPVEAASQPAPQPEPTPQQPPMYAPLDAPEGKMLVNGEWLDMPVILQAMQLAAEEQRVARETAEFHADSPSPTSWAPATRVHPDPRRAMFGQRQIKPPRQIPVEDVALEAGITPGSFEHPGSFKYPDQYGHTLAVTRELKDVPAGGPVAPVPEAVPEAVPDSTPRSPWQAFSPAWSMEDLAAVGEGVADAGEAVAGVGDYLPSMPSLDLPAGMPEGADAPEEEAKRERLLGLLGLDKPTSPYREREAKIEAQEQLRDEFMERAERPEGDPGGYMKASLDPFDFAGTVLENRTLATWGEAMWERFFQLFEVPVEKAYEGDLRLQRLFRREEWDSDEDMEFSGLTQFIPGVGWSLETGKTNTLSASDRRGLERLWDEQDDEVIKAVEEQLTDAEAKAALYPFLTNARHSVGNLANGLWDMGVSLVGGNIPVEVWKEKDPEERKRMLEEQAHEAIDEMFGKGMASFVITTLSNPTAAVEVYPAELSFVMYRPMKAMARPAGRGFVSGMDALLEWQGAKGPKRAAVASAVKRGAAATKRAFADPAYHYTKGGEEFLQQTGREARLAEEAVKEGMDVVTRSVSEETAAGRPPEVVKPDPVPLTDRQRYLQEIVFDSPEEAARLTAVKPDKAALEAGVLDSVEGLSGTRWPHTPRRQLGYDYETRTVPISAESGKATRPPRRAAEKTRRDPEPTLLPEEAMDMIRDLSEIFGENGAILRGIVTEEGLAQQVIAGVDIRLANQLTSPKARSTVVDAVVEEANAAFWGGNMPTAVKRSLKETVDQTLQDAAGRRRGEGGSSSVFNPIFELEGPGGNTVSINATQALARRQKNNPEFRAEVAREALDYVSERIGAQTRAAGIQDGVMNTIVRDSEVVGKTEYAMSSGPERAAMRADALKGGKAVESHTRLKRKLEREKAKPDKDQDAAAIDRMSDQLYEMEHGSGAKPGLVDDYLSGIVDTYRRTGERPSTWLFGDVLETAWQRLEQSSPEAMRGLWMLREHMKPTNATKVFGAGLTGDQALMSTYFGFTPPPEGAMAAFRRASAKPLTDVTQLMPDRWMSKPLYSVSELMARDAGVLPSMYATKWMERLWRDIKLGKVAGNPGSHVMALGSNTLVQAQRRGDLFIGSKAATSLVDYMRYKAGMKTMVDPQVYRSLEASGRVSGAMIKGEIDANLRRALDDPDFATTDWRGDFMTFGVGRRVYDWWDTMFKIEDGVNQYNRRIKEWESLPAGTRKNPVEYHFPISRTKTIRAQKINGKMVVDNRTLTDAQFRHMMGRAAMEPGSRIFVDFKDAPLAAVFKRNFPLLDMLMSDFSTWRMVTDTLPFLKEGIVGEIMLGSTPRGYTSHGPLRAARMAEMGTANLARTMMAATLSQRVSGEDSEFMRSMLNRYGGASPVFSISATQDPRVLSVSNGTSFSVYESVERWLRMAEAIGSTAPSRGLYGEAMQEWVGYLKPDATIQVPGEEGAQEGTTEMMMLLSDKELARLSPAKRRHVEQSIAYWKDNAKTGGMGRKATMGLAYLEGNLYLNLFADWLFETRKEAEMDLGWSVADTVLRSFAPKWLSNLGLYGLESKREGDIEEWRELVDKLSVEEQRIAAIPEADRTEAEGRRLAQLRDDEWRKDLQEKHLRFAAGVTAITRGEYRPDAILGALDPSLAEPPLRKLAQRMLHAPAYIAAFDRYVYDEYKKRQVKDVKGMGAEGFKRKETAIHSLIDRTSRQFGRGLFDAIAIAKEATFAGDEPTAAGSKAHEALYSPAGKVKDIQKLFREILNEEADAMIGRWFDAFPVRARKAQQKGLETAPIDLLFSRSPTQEIPLEGWRTPPRP